VFPLPPGDPVTHLKLDVYPDGGLSRLRLWGELAEGA
jgi:allantoicase